MSAREALDIAKGAGSPCQIASAVEVLVEARIANDNSQEAVEVATAELKALQQSGSPYGVATAMSAAIVAETAFRGVEAGLAKVKEIVEDRRSKGDKKGEIAMLLSWACMAQYPDVAMNTAQVAKKLAQETGDAIAELNINKRITDLWVAKGKPEKAPTRKQALFYLKELAAELEKEDGEKFEDALKKLGPYMSAITEGDLEAILYKVVLKDEALYGEFLEEHGFWPKREKA